MSDSVYITPPYAWRAINNVLLLLKYIFLSYIQFIAQKHVL
jgi:hypothetical protein